jgi:predicted AlkP superfamily pyrophosphatase or phosphodiesterase
MSDAMGYARSLAAFRPGRVAPARGGLALIGFGIVAAVSGCSRDPAPADDPATEVAAPDDALLAALARSYVPGRVGDIAVIPAPSAVISWADGNYEHMHGSPWDYDRQIPLLIHAPGRITAGDRPEPVSHQDIGATIMDWLGVLPADSITGEPLPEVLAAGPTPDLIVVLVLDAFRPDLLVRFADRLPSLSRIAAGAVRWPEAAVNYVPTNTATAHTTLATATDPRVHGIPGNSFYDRGQGESVDVYDGADPSRLRMPTISDRWLAATGGLSTVVIQGGTDYPATALAGRGGCADGGHRPNVMYYDSGSGVWGSGDCYDFSDAAIDLADSPVVEERDRDPSEFRRSAGFARLEVRTLTARIAASAIGADTVPDLVFANLKATDYVSHKYGPFSPEMRETLEELDRQIGDLYGLIESRSGDFVLVITADHGMPPEPPEGLPRISYDEVRALIDARFDPDGPGVVLHFEGSENQLYLDHDRLARLGLDIEAVARFLESQAFVDRAIPEADVAARAALLPDPYGR